MIRNKTNTFGHSYFARIGLIGVESVVLVALVILLLIDGTAAASEKGLRLCGSSSRRGEIALASHEFFQKRRGLRSTEGLRSQVTRAGNVVLIEGDQQLIEPANPFNLHGTALVFEPGPAGGYVVTKESTSLDLSLGRERRLGDDASLAIELPFTVSFFGVERSNLFLNSNGNLTFQTERPYDYPYTDVFVNGPPRIGVLFNDLNPSAGGSIRLMEQPDRVVVTWNAVPEWNTNNKNTFQVEIEPGGRITMRYSREIDAKTGITGLASGDAEARFAFVDFGGSGGQASSTFLERFYDDPIVDEVATVKRFYQEFPDVFDAVVLWTDFRSHLDDALAYRASVRNDVRGIGKGIYNRTSRWGSSGQLKGVLVMGDLTRYPQSPYEPYSWTGEGLSTLGLVAHETGHRWLSFVEIQDGNAPSDALLGRGGAHWSFFLDSEASFMEGNDFVQEGDNRFRSDEIESRYSMLDLYLMGLAGDAEVAPFYYIADGSGTSRWGQPFTNESGPERGAIVRGTKRKVLIDAVVRAEGPRIPDVDSSPKQLRQAWVLLSFTNRPASAALVGKIDGLRAAWEGYFQDKTLGRATVSTSLAQ